MFWDFDRFERRAWTNLIKFSQIKYMLLHMDWGNTKYKCRLDNDWIENSHVEKDLGVFVYGKLNTRQEYMLTPQKANHILSCIKRGISS